MFECWHWTFINFLFIQISISLMIFWTNRTSKIESICDWKVIRYICSQGRSHWRGQGGHCPPTSISKPNKVQEFQFQISGMLLFMAVQKLCGPEISRFLPCMLQFLDNSRRLFIFSNYMRGIDHFTLDLLKRSDT